MGPSLILTPAFDPLHATRARRQEVLSRDDLPPGFPFQLQPRLLRDVAPGLGGGLICGHASGAGGLRDLAGGEFGECSKDEFGLAQVSGLATSVSRIFPSPASSFNR